MESGGSNCALRFGETRITHKDPLCFEGGGVPLVLLGAVPTEVLVGALIGMGLDGVYGWRRDIGD